MDSKINYEAASTGSVRNATVSRAELLIDGSDRKFRFLLREMDHLNSLLVTGRGRIAESIGLTTPQYNIIMVLYEIEDEAVATVSAVARFLHVSGPFITNQTNLLVKKGMVERYANPEDRRSTLLRLTASGRIAIAELLPELQTFNSCVFAGISRGQFETLGEIVSTLIDNWSEADRYLPRPKLRPKFP